MYCTTTYTPHLNVIKCNQVESFQISFSSNQRHSLNSRPVPNAKLLQRRFRIFLFCFCLSSKIERRRSSSACKRRRSSEWWWRRRVSSVTFDWCGGSRTSSSQPRRIIHPTRREALQPIGSQNGSNYTSRILTGSNNVEPCVKDAPFLRTPARRCCM